MEERETRVAGRKNAVLASPERAHGRNHVVRPQSVLTFMVNASVKCLCGGVWPPLGCLACGTGPSHQRCNNMVMIGLERVYPLSHRLMTENCHALAIFDGAYADPTTSI